MNEWCRVGVETMAILFSAPEKRTAWEAAFHEAKQKLGMSFIDQIDNQ